MREGPPVEPDPGWMRPAVRRLVLLRHGRTAWNDVGRAQGHADVELDQTGHGQASAAASYLQSLRPVAVWTSDLVRARQTCRYLEQATGLRALIDVRLREFDVGERQGLSASEFAQRFPEAYAAWLGGDLMPVVPGAEDARSVRTRMDRALRECLAALAQGETGIVVTHGAALKLGVVSLLKWPDAVARDLRGVGNCSWVTLECTPGPGYPASSSPDVDGPPAGVAAPAAAGAASGEVRLSGYNQSVLAAGLRARAETVGTISTSVATSEVSTVP